MEQCDLLWSEQARVENPALTGRERAHRTHGVNKKADHHDFFKLEKDLQTY